MFFLQLRSEILDLKHKKWENDNSIRGSDIILKGIIWVIQLNTYLLLPSQIISVSFFWHGMSRNVSCWVHLSVLPSWQVLTWSCSAAHILPSPNSWQAPSFIQFPNILSVYSKIIDLVHISLNFLTFRELLMKFEKLYCNYLFLIRLCIR